MVLEDLKLDRKLNPAEDIHKAGENEEKSRKTSSPLN